MFWAGPATTMHQRLYVPDWTTAALIQPLGLAEDVAVVIATWAASDPRNAIHAELALYLFMLAMNAANYSAKAAPPRSECVEHLCAALCVALAAGHAATQPAAARCNAGSRRVSRSQSTPASGPWDRGS